jgi:CheY-like chemotaxis protein
MALDTPSRPHVLLIDDEPAMHRIVHRLLSREVFLLPISSASEALSRIVAGCRYDAIVCDVEMPRMTGAEFMRELRKVSAVQAARVVFMSGGVRDPETIAFLRSLPNRLVAKPFMTTELREALRLA